MRDLRETLMELVSAWRAGDALRASAFFAEDGVYHEVGREPVRGRNEIATYFTRFFRDGPAWQFEIQDIIVEGERAAVAYRFAIHTSDGWHELAGCALVRREGGSIAEWREYHG